MRCHNGAGMRLRRRGQHAECIVPVLTIDPGSVQVIRDLYNGTMCVVTGVYKYLLPKIYELHCNWRL
jgi:hypothetical protein